MNNYYSIFKNFFNKLCFLGDGTGSWSSSGRRKFLFGKTFDSNARWKSSRSSWQKRIPDATVTRCTKNRGQESILHLITQSNGFTKESKQSQSLLGADFELIFLFQIDSTKPGVTNANEGVLANFFNALLSKKTSTGASPSSSNIRPGGKNGWIVFWKNT